MWDAENWYYYDNIILFSNTFFLSFLEIGKTLPPSPDLIENLRKFTIQQVYGDKIIKTP